MSNFNVDIKQFNCSFCDKTYAHQTSLTRHMKIHQSTSPTIVIINGLPVEEVLGVHAITPRFLNSLPVGEVYDNSDVTQQSKQFNCLFCDKTFAHQPSLTRHMKIHQSTSPSIAVTNGLPVEEVLDVHAVTPRIINGLSVGEVYDNSDVTQQSKQFNCLFCGKTFAHQPSLTRHMKTHQSTSPSIAVTNGLPVEEFAEVAEVSDVTQQSKQFNCSVCGKTFAHQPSLARHMRIHKSTSPPIAVTNGLPVEEILDVPAVTPRISNVLSVGEVANIPVVTQHSKQFNCSLCDKTFAHHPSLARHMRIHKSATPVEEVGDNTDVTQQSKQFNCSLCDKTFAHHPSLARHMRIHKSATPVEEVGDNTDVTRQSKQFNCSLCGKKFSHQPSLSRHKKVHRSPGPPNGFTNVFPFCKVVNVTPRIPKVLSVGKVSDVRPADITQQKPTNSLNLCCFKNCDYNLPSHIKYRQHLLSFHNVQITKEIKCFDSFEEFNKWKSNIEERTTSFFRKTRSHNNVSYFDCNRSGRSKPKLKRSRRFKSTPFYQTGRICPARMATKQYQNGSVRLIFYSDHIGHEHDPKCIRQSKMKNKKNVREKRRKKKKNMEKNKDKDEDCHSNIVCLELENEFQKQYNDTLRYY